MTDSSSKEADPRIADMAGELMHAKMEAARNSATMTHLLQIGSFRMEIVPSSDINVNIEPNSITVKAENGDKRKYNYSRRFKPTVDVDSAKATFKNGVLDITVSKVDTKPKGKSIKIA